MMARLEVVPWSTVRMYWLMKRLPFFYSGRRQAKALPSAKTPSKPLVILAAAVGNSAHGIKIFCAASLGDITQAHDTHKILILFVVQHHQPLNMLLMHIFQYVLDLFIFVTKQYLGRHHRGNFILGSPTVHHGPGCDVTVRYDADQAFAFGDRRKSVALFRQALSRFADTSIRINEFSFFRHQLFHLHSSSPFNR